MVRAFPYLLLPHLLSSRNRARRRERGDFSRGLLFGGVGIVVCAALFEGVVLADRPARRTTTSSATTCCGSACRGCS